MAAELDRETARALAEAGYMPLAEYLDRFGEEIRTSTAVREQDHLEGTLTLRFAGFGRRSSYRPTQVRVGQITYGPRRQAS